MIEAKHKELAVDKYMSIHLVDHYNDIPSPRAYI